MEHSHMGHHAHMDHSAMDHGQHHMMHSSSTEGGHGMHGDHGSRMEGEGTASPLMVAPHEHAEPEMSHGMHGGHMMMYFHGGFNEVILFDFWRINSVGGLVGSMAIIFIMGVCYEGLKALRDALYR